MRVTQVLSRQHINWHFKMQWRIFRHRNVLNDGSANQLKLHGKEVVDAVESIINEPQRPPNVPSEFIESKPFNELEHNESHPFWKSRSCHIFGDKNVLICGKKQAQNLTKTIIVNELPPHLQKSVDNVNIDETTDVQMKNSILQAHLYDAHQEKLAKKKHPVKLMWVFAREYGITDQQKNRFITDKLIQYCEKFTNPTVLSERKILNDVIVSTPFEKDGDYYQFQKTLETLILSKKPLSNIDDEMKFATDSIPDIYPLKSNISIDAQNIYEIQNFYPVEKGANFEHPHTAFIHYTPLDVFNCTLEPVTEDQIESRTLLKAFTLAAAKAQSLYGTDVKDLPKPITVQCVQLHINKFYFGVYQLNTLHLDGNDGNKNYWFTKSPIQLYENCEYRESRPVLLNYNNDVLRHAIAFYQNQ